LIWLISVGLWLGYGKRKKRARLTAGSRPLAKQEREARAAVVPRPAHAGAGKSGKASSAQLSPIAREGRSRPARTGLQATGPQIRR
jgi:hypothetical protein